MFSLLAMIPGFLNGLVTWLNKREDTALEKFRVDTVSGKEVSIELIKGEIARTNSLRDVGIAAMNHPIWWAAWALGVFPVLGYHAAVFWVSIFPGLGWTILKVPPDQLEFGKLVVQYMFGIGGVTAVTGTIMSRWAKR